MSKVSPICRLYCFPYAGASATAVYAKWRYFLPEWLDVYCVEYPGRGHRINEKLRYSIQDLAHKLIEEISKELYCPYMFFGHSLGAIVAFEVTRLLHYMQIPLPNILFVSGRNAPYTDGLKHKDSLYTDNEILLKMHELDGTLPEIFDQPEILELMLPILRADFYMSEHYKYTKQDVLNCFIQVFGGVNDHTTTIDGLNAWSNETSNKSKIDLFNGGHFFLRNEEQKLLKLIIARTIEILDV